MEIITKHVQNQMVLDKKKENWKTDISLKFHFQDIKEFFSQIFDWREWSI